MEDQKIPQGQPQVATSAVVRLGVVALGDLYADACAVCGRHGYYGLASVYGHEGCVEAVRNGRVYCELHLPRDSQPNEPALALGGGGKPTSKPATNSSEKP